MKKTGELLKKARESKGLSLHEVGQSLKINSKILKAIEDDDQKHLPAKTFLRGFVQSYAQYLKMNMDEVMAVFAEEMGSTRPSPILKSDEAGSEEMIIGTQQKNEPPAENIRISQPTQIQIKPILSGLVVVVLLLLIFSVKKMVDKYQREAVVQVVKIDNPLPVESPKADTALISETELIPSGTPLAVSSIAQAEVSHSLEHSNLPAETPAKNFKTLDLPSNKVAAAAISSPTPTPSPTLVPKVVAAVVANKKADTKTAAVPAKPIETKLPEPKPTPDVKPVVDAEKNKKIVELIVEAMDSVEIEYSSITGKSGKIKLSAEQVHTFKSSNGLKLNIDNGGAVNLILNGKDLGVPGELGKPIRLTY